MRDRVYLLCLVLLFALPTALHAQCAGVTAETTFYVNDTGQIARTLSETEGPATICIVYDSLRFDIRSFESSVVAKGPDPNVPSPTGSREALSAKNQALMDQQRQLLADIRTLVLSLDVAFNTNQAVDPADKIVSAYLPSGSDLKSRFEQALPKEIEADDKDLYLAVQYWRKRFDAIGLDQTITARCDLKLKTDSSTPEGKSKAADNSQNCQVESLVRSRFALRKPIACNLFTNKSVTDALSVTVTDQINTTNEDGLGKAKEPVENKAFVTVSCASRVSVSAGVALSTVPSREFAITPSAGATPDAAAVSKFGLLSDSSIHPVPIALTHYRFIESKNHLIGYTATIGIAANIQGTNAGSTSVEYLAGASIVLGRFLYITPGVYFGTETKLAGGFKVGDQVPANYGTTIQLTKSYEPRFGIAFSFSKP